MSKMGRRPQREPRGYLVEELPRRREGPEVGAPGARSKGRKETSVARVEEAGEGGRCGCSDARAGSRTAAGHRAGHCQDRGSYSE